MHSQKIVFFNLTPLHYKQKPQERQHVDYNKVDPSTDSGS